MKKLITYFGKYNIKDISTYKKHGLFKNLRRVIYE